MAGKKSARKVKRVKDLQPRPASGRKVKGGVGIDDVIKRTTDQIRRRGGPAT